MQGSSRRVHRLNSNLAEMRRQPLSLRNSSSMPFRRLQRSGSECHSVFLFCLSDRLHPRFRTSRKILPSSKTRPAASDTSANGWSRHSGKDLPLVHYWSDPAAWKVLSSRSSGAVSSGRDAAGRKRAPTLCSPSNAAAKTINGPTSLIGGPVVPQPPDQRKMGRTPASS